MDIHFLYKVRGNIRHPKGHWEARTHSDYDVWCIAKGSVEVRFETNTVRLSEGDLFLFNQGQTYRAEFTEDTELHYYHFLLRDSAGRDLVIEDLSSSTLRNAETFLSDMRCARDWGPFRNEKENLILSALLMDHFKNQGITEESFSFAEQKQRMDAIDAYIDENITRAVSCEELARFSGVHVNYLSQFIKRNRGRSTVAYIRKKRMAYAREQLMQSGNKVVTVAKHMGFPDQFTFSKMYKKEYGLSPVEDMKKRGTAYK